MRSARLKGRFIATKLARPRAASHTEDRNAALLRSSLGHFFTKILVVVDISFASVYDGLEQFFERFVVDANNRGHVRESCRLVYARFPLDHWREHQQRPALVALTSRLLLRGTNP